MTPNEPLDGVAIVYADGAFNTPNGKTAHGLVRFTRRYRVAAVIDRVHAGGDAGQVLDRRPNGIPVVADLAAARAAAPGATHFVFGIAPDGGRLEVHQRAAVAEALEAGLHVDAGLHDFLSEDPAFAAGAARNGVRIRDVRRTPERGELHGFTGKIEEVTSLRIAVLGTDSAVGKRTTAWKIVQGFEAAGRTAQMVGTGQTAWLQGAKYGTLTDSLVSDFMAGEIEHAAWSAWHHERPDVLVLEGQGSLMNPAYPGGYELIAAGRPHVIVVQHAPARKEYDGFPGYPIQPLAVQIDLLQRISERPVVAVTVNHEDIPPQDIERTCQLLGQVVGVPTFDVLEFESGELSASALVNLLSTHLR